MEDSKALRKSVTMFVVTLFSVFLVFGYQWTAGDPLKNSETAIQSLKFSVALMMILLSHELGHYIVARRHGFKLSLPYFIPFPFAFGTLGAVISLKSLPKNRTALLEMGAAGPIAGFVASAIAILIGMPNTLNHKLPLIEPGTEQIMILADPPLMKGIGHIVLGEPLSPFATLDPIAFAGWVGCMLTAINMLPIGQLDGGHICNAIFPKFSRIISKYFILLLFLGTIFWPGWLIWGLMLLLMGAWRGIPMECQQPLTQRSKWIAIGAVVSLLFSFMLRPIQIKEVPKDQVEYKKVEK